MSKVIQFPVSDNETVGDVVNTMTEKQKEVMYALVSEALYKCPVEPGHPKFICYMATLTEIALTVTDENFVAIQRVQADILNSYAAGDLSDLEKHTLYTASTIIMDWMRKILRGGGTK